MKPRIEKKLSKRLALILSGVRGFTPKEVWIDNELELSQVHYRHHKGRPLSPKEKRKNYQQKVRVNNMPSVGGELDYWGEGTDFFSVFEAAKETLIWTMFEHTSFDPETMCGGSPIVTMKLTGKNVIALAKRYAEREATSRRS